MQEETRIALMNYDWLVRNKGLDVVELDWGSDTVIDSDSGGSDVNLLIDPNYTPGPNIERERPLTAEPPF